MCPVYSIQETESLLEDLSEQYYFSDAEMQWPPMILRMETKVYCDPFYTLASGFSDPTAPHGDCLVNCVESGLWRANVEGDSH